MRTLKKNKQELYYALLIGERPVYELDENGEPIIDYIDEEGNKYYRETGEYELVYSKPESFLGNIAMSGGESQTQEFGVDVSSYDAVLVLDKDEIPITETSLIWFEGEVGYRDSARTFVDGHTADYKVLALKPSLNQFKAILKRNTK